MVEWEILSSNCVQSKWDELLLCAEDSIVFQSFGWGEFKRVSGWLPLRCVARNKNGQIVAMIQILTKKYPGNVNMGWAPGGPVLSFLQSKPDETAEIMQQLLEKINGNYKRLLIRFNSQTLGDDNLSFYLNRICVRPFFKLNSGYSYFIDLLQPIEYLKQQMTSKHRYYSKKALGENIQWRSGYDDLAIKDLLQVHEEMVINKKMEDIRSSVEEITNLTNSLKTNAIIFTGYLDDIPISSCLVLRFGKKAFYMMAATNARGREISASYAMVVKLLEWLKNEGISRFDFGGIDPRNHEAQGVNHFKKGFGGTLVEYLGEWEWSSSEWLRFGFNMALSRRGGRL